MTMTLMFDDASTEAVAAKSPVRRVGAAVASAFAGWQAARARRIALASLMDMEAYRLDDLGINAQDVAEALKR